MNLQQIIKTLLAILFSFGKMISATGQTLFGMRHSVSYFLNITSSNPISLSIAGVAALCSLFIIIVTRVPAIFRQLAHSQAKVIITPAESEKCTINTNHFSPADKLIYNFSTVSSLACGVFSAIGAYLATITLIEFFLAVHQHLQTIRPSESLPIQGAAIFVAISTFISYYSFNYFKTKQNTSRYLAKDTKKHIINFRDKHVIKTIIVSLGSMISVPFLSYFLTKHALLAMPIIGALPYFYLKLIAALSSLAALITNITTTVPATYQYFIEKKDRHFSLQADLSVRWKTLKNYTIIAGFVDCTANGLSNFISVVDVASDITGLEASIYMLLLATGCGISSALLTAAFSIRQGFYDFMMTRQQLVRTDKPITDELLELSNI